MSKREREAANNLAHDIKSFFLDWPQFDPTHKEYGQDVNGADLVDWFSEQAPYWLAHLMAAYKAGLFLDRTREVDDA